MRGDLDVLCFSLMSPASSDWLSQGFGSIPLGDRIMHIIARGQETAAQRKLAVAIMLLALGGCSKPQPGATTPTAAAPAAVAAGPDFSSTLCVALRKTTPAVKGMAPAPARAQLVLDIADAFGAKREALSRVSSDIDTIAKTRCPEVRAPLLAATGSASLQDAVR
jgi:hypothetical protein